MPLLSNTKFRGKSIDDYNWYYGACDFLGDRAYIILGNGERVEVIPETVGQFSGFLDVNRIEIYDGDLITDMSIREIGGCSATGYPYNIYLVRFVNGCFVADCFNTCKGRHSFGSSHFLFEMGESEVVSSGYRLFIVLRRITILGNVFDTPELLER